MWNKIKNIYDGFAQLPVVQDRNECLRIYFSQRINKISFINYIEVKKSNFKVIYKNKTPVLSPNLEGTFDDCGVMSSCMVHDKMYYTGWNVCKNETYRHAIGTATFNEKKNIFERDNIGPLIDRSVNVPFLANSPFIDSKNNHLYFCNGTGWIGFFPTYNICRCNLVKNSWEFDHGFTPLGSKRHATSRIFKNNDDFYFAAKTKDSSYKIWCNGKIVLEPSGKSKWDSDMTCYPFIFENYMFYNGNGYGATGIGVAELT